MTAGMAGYRRVWTEKGRPRVSHCSSLSTSPASVFAAPGFVSSLPCVCALLHHVLSLLRELRLVWGESDQGEESVLGVAIWVRAFGAAGGQADEETEGAGGAYDIGARSTSGRCSLRGAEAVGARQKHTPSLQVRSRFFVFFSSRFF